LVIVFMFDFDRGLIYCTHAWAPDVETASPGIAELQCGQEMERRCSGP
jgi:hypothetical protein